MEKSQVFEIVLKEGFHGGRMQVTTPQGYAGGVKGTNDVSCTTEKTGRVNICTWRHPVRCELEPIGVWKCVSKTGRLSCEFFAMYAEKDILFLFADISSDNRQQLKELSEKQSNQVG